MLFARDDPTLYVLLHINVFFRALACFITAHCISCGGRVLSCPCRFFRRATGLGYIHHSHAGDEHDLLWLLAARHIYGDSPAGPQDDSACLPLHVLGCRPHGDDVPEAICECGQAPVTMTMTTTQSVLLVVLLWNVDCELYKRCWLLNQLELLL